MVFQVQQWQIIQIFLKSYTHIIHLLFAVQFYTYRLLTVYEDLPPK